MMGDSRYGIPMGRPRKPEEERRVVRNVRIDPNIDARVLAFQAQEGFGTYTLALEWLLKRGLRGVESGVPRQAGDFLPSGASASDLATVAELSAHYAFPIESATGQK